MKQHKSRACVVCSKQYKPTGPCAKYCSKACKSKIWTRAILRQRVYDWQVKKGIIKNPGIGTGHAQLHGADNPTYKVNAPHRYRDFLKDACERCGSTKFLCGHHKDRKGIQSKRPNNKPSNIETLCKSCHQKEHNVYLNFTRKAS